MGWPTSLAGCRRLFTTGSNKLLAELMNPLSAHVSQHLQHWIAPSRPKRLTHRRESHVQHWQHIVQLACPAAAETLQAMTAIGAFLQGGLLVGLTCGAASHHRLTGWHGTNLHVHSCPGVPSWDIFCKMLTCLCTSWAAGQRPGVPSGDNLCHPQAHRRAPGRHAVLQHDHIHGNQQRHAHEECVRPPGGHRGW